MHDRLMGDGAVVLEHVAPLGARFGDHGTAKSGKHATDRRRRFVGEFVQTGLRLLGNHQQMTRGERRHIEEGKHLLVLVDAVAGDLASENLREDRGHRRTVPGSPGGRPASHAGRSGTVRGMAVDELDRIELPDLAKRLLGTPLVARLLDLAIDEDLGRGDITTELFVDPSRRAAGAIVARGPGVLAGVPLLEIVLRKRAGATRFKALKADGDRFEAGDPVLELEGPLRGILPLERTMLNLLGRLSGVATRTARFVAAVEGSGAVVCDTRKTTPGLRMPEKYAVRCGGGTLHRLDLAEAMLVKDNHVASATPDRFAAKVAEVAAAARRDRSVRFVEVEVDTLEQLDRILDLPEGTVDLVLLDNMDDATLREAVARRDQVRPGVRLEASGGVTLKSVAATAATGVERVACGSLTRDAVWIDFGLDLLNAVPPSGG